METIEAVVNNPLVRTVVVTGSLCGALLTITVFARRGWRGLVSIVSMQVAAGRLIHAELSPNGGGSLLDKVSRIDSNHREAERHWTAIEKKVEGIERTMTARGEVLSEIERRVTDIDGRLKKVDL